MTDQVLTSEEYFKEAFRLKAYLINGLCRKGLHLVDAESIVIETIQMVEKHKDKLEVKNLIAYLTTSVRFRLSNTMRNAVFKNAYRTIPVSSIEEPFKDKRKTAIENHESEDSVEFILKCIDELPEKDAEVIRIIAEGGTYEDAARVRGVSRQRCEQILKKYSSEIHRKLRLEGIIV